MLNYFHDSVNKKAGRGQLKVGKKFNPPASLKRLEYHNVLNLQN